MSYNSATGVYTPASGAISATAGQTIASATWNSIHSDLATALTSLGEGMIPVLTTGQVGAQFMTAPVQCNFAAAAGDIGTFPLPTITNALGFRIVSMNIFGAAATLNGAVVSLYTAASAGGTVVISSTATTITSSLANNNNSMQVITPVNSSTEIFSTANLFLHVTSSTSTSSTAWVQIVYTPLVT